MPATTPSPALLIIGLDGLDLNLLQNLVPATVMPTLNRYLRRGITAPLRSVIPTQSAAAWATFMTGQTPAGHGVFDFMQRLPDGHYRHSRPQTDQTLWHYLGAHGLTGGVFNFPVTFPPFPINGWLVSGMLTPHLSRGTAPAELAQTLLAEFPDYTLDLEWQLYTGRPADLLADASRLVAQRARVATFLLQREPLAYLALAFTVTDRVQHLIWQYLDASHPFYDAAAAAALQPQIYAFYRALDEAVRQVIAAVDAGTTIIFLSDHGFKPAAWQFLVNDWLAGQDWLHFSGRNHHLARRLRAWEPHRLRQLRRRLYPDMSRHLPGLTETGAIQWDRTLAFCPWHNQQGIRLNLQGREPHGVVRPGREAEQLLDQIMNALAGLRHPQTGQKVISDLFLTADYLASKNAGSGRFAAEMPDMLFDPAPGFATGTFDQRQFAPLSGVSGDHSREGFLVIHNPAGAQEQVSSKASLNARLEDVAPTIMSLCGLSIPEAMHGRSLLVGQSVAPVMAGTAPAGPQPETATDTGRLSTEEEEYLLRHLRNLGYM